MDPRNHRNHCESVIAFTLENPQPRPQYQCGRDPVCGTKVTPQLLSLFPFTPVLHPSKKRDSVKSSLRHGVPQMSEKGSGKDVVNGSESELRSQNHAGRALLMLSTFGASKHVLEDQTTFQKPVKKPRKKASSLSSKTPSSWVGIGSVCHQSSCTPSVDRSDMSSKGKGQCLQAIEELISAEQRSTNAYNGASTSKTRKTNGSASPSSSTASAQNVTPLTTSFTPSQHATVVQILGGQAELGDRSLNQGKRTRHGPRPKSSPFRGVTHYKRTGRWEAHIWKKGKQIYLGASSTSEKAARAYDRAAIYFRRMGAELNFYLEDYAGELRQLMGISEKQLVKMLRKQSAGQGTLHPQYPPVRSGLRHSPILVVPITEEENRKKRPGSSSAVETVPHVGQVDPSYFKGLGLYSSPIGTMVQSHQPQGEECPRSSVVETIPQGTQVDTSNFKCFGLCSNFMAQSHQPQGKEPPSNSVLETIPHGPQVNLNYFKGFASKAQRESTLHAPKAGHVSERRGQYLQLIDNMIADIQSPKA